jgi:hypothetical protein
VCVCVCACVRATGCLRELGAALLPSGSLSTLFGFSWSQTVRCPNPPRRMSAALCPGVRVKTYQTIHWSEFSGLPRPRPSICADSAVRVRRISRVASELIRFVVCDGVFHVYLRVHFRFTLPPTCLFANHRGLTPPPACPPPHAHNLSPSAAQGRSLVPVAPRRSGYGVCMCVHVAVIVCRACVLLLLLGQRFACTPVPSPLLSSLFLLTGACPSCSWYLRPPSRRSVGVPVGVDWRCTCPLVGPPPVYLSRQTATATR